jgi:Tol biopolymer transport system component/tetratricopeptide (TPR) repeat protein
MIGQILSNRYKLLAELGNGGMAWVYLAQDLREGRQVAVKVLYPQLGQDVGFLQRFTREAKLVMGLSHSSPEMHVVSVLDYGSDREVHYLVMEYTPGQNLRQALDRWGALSWQEALDIARQVGLALGHAHRHGIVHRDVKPENIMLLPDGAVRVLDFGVARARTSPTLTHTGFVGSPFYAAPEQVMGQPVDTRADLYALGIVLYEMLAGSRPFKSDTPWAVINQHIASPPPLLEEAQPGLPNPVYHLVRKAMAKRPEDRFQTPGEMVEAIEAVLAGRPLPAESASPQPEVLAPILAGVYQRARQAAEQEDWNEAVDLFGQILRLDPRYRDVVEQLAEAGRQARLAALYAAARRALQTGEYSDALAQLEEIALVAPQYRDIDKLQTQARRLQARHQLYQRGIQHLEAQEWTAAVDCLAQVQAEEPHYLQVSQLLATARAEREKQQATRKLRRERPARLSARRLLWGIVAVLLLAIVAESYLLYRSQQPRAAAAVSDTATVTLPTAPEVPSVVARPTATAAPPQPTPRPSPTVQTPSPQPAFTTAPPPTATASATASPSATPTASQTATASATAMSPPPTGEPTEPPLTGQIAFPRFDPERGTYDVYVCRVDGSACRQVAAEASQPDFLPGGDQIVLHSWQPDQKGLILQTLAGQRLWKITDSLEAARPSVDPAGVAYVYHSRQESDREPRLFRTYGTETRPLLHDGGAIPGQSPTWTPDGQILFSGCWQDACGILAIDADGTHPRQIVAGSTETNPEASPSGQQIAFMSQRDGNWDVYAVDADGSHLRRLTDHPGNDGLPTWSPDGRWLAFVSDRGERWAIWAMRPDGSGLRHLFDLGGSLDGRVRAAAPHETHGWVEERISWAPLP